MRIPPIVLLIFFIFFVISFLTNILGPLIPDIIQSFELSLGLAGFLPFSFFVAYGVASIPAGVLLEKYGEKKMMAFAFLLAFAGAVSFGLNPVFSTALFSLFLIGIGMAILQVVINPLLRTAGGDVNFAFFSVMGQLFFGAASFISPMLYSYLVANVHSGHHSGGIISLFDSLVTPDLKWVSLYWVFAVISLAMVIVVGLVSFPKVELKEDERIDTGKAFGALLKDKYVWMYFLGIFCYVGTEQGVANWVSQFLQEYHGMNAATTGASVVSWFWGLLTIGCLLGLLLLKIWDSRRVLIIFTTGAILSLLAGLFGPAEVAVLAFPMVGFFASVMWSVVVSLALNSVAHYHGTFAGILCTGIVGGAVMPLVVGTLGDLVGLRYGMLFLLFTLGYILSIGFWARPLVNNATLKKS